ncbi:MAG: hydratase [Pseudomonadota bacterium]
MTERKANALNRDSQGIAIGPSMATWNGMTLDLSLREMAVPIPKPIRGSVRVTPHVLTDTPRDITPCGRHKWWPIAPQAHVELLLEKPALSWSGTGYVDSNWGERPLESDFLSWQWSRAHVGDATAVIYDCQLPDSSEHSLSLLIGPDGQASDLDLPVHRPLPRTGWRVDRSTRTGKGGSARVERTLEDTPFYARSLLATDIAGQTVTAFHESLSLSRFSSAWVKALLPWRMPRRTV